MWAVWLSPFSSGMRATEPVGRCGRVHRRSLECLCRVLLLLMAVFVCNGLCVVSVWCVKFGV